MWKIISIFVPKISPIAQATMTASNVEISRLLMFEDLPSREQDSQSCVIRIRGTMELRLVADSQMVRRCYETFVMSNYEAMRSDDMLTAEVLDVMRDFYKALGRRDCVAAVAAIRNDMLAIEMEDIAWQKLNGRKPARGRRAKVEYDNSKDPCFGLTDRYEPESVVRMEKALVSALKGRFGIRDGFVEDVFLVLRGIERDMVIKAKSDRPKLIVRLIVDELVEESNVYAAKGDLNAAVLSSFLMAYGKTYATDGFTDESRATTEAQEILEAITAAKRELQKQTGMHSRTHSL